jgi:hypothetical protein
MRRLSTILATRHVAAALATAMVIVIAGMSAAVNASAQGMPNAGAPLDEQASASRNRASDVGEATSAWLALQRGNAAAAPALPTPGAQATLAYERYMDSFRTRIPASFGSTLSGGSNGARGGYTNVGAAQPVGAN